MQISKPQVHLRRLTGTTIYYVHVITWMDSTQFVASGHAPLPTTDEDGVFTILLNIKKDESIHHMKLLTPIVHTLSLEGLDLSHDNPCIEVIVRNESNDYAEVGKRKTHTDDADDSAQPSPKLKNG